MQRVLLIILLSLLALTGQAATSPRGGEKLLQLLRLPHLESSFGFSFNVDRGLVLQESGRDVQAEIAALKSSLKGDPSDADRLYQLSQLYLEASDEGSARTNIEYSVAAFRKQVDLQPDNGPLLARFGLALNAADKQNEAENVLRHAVAISPKESSCWLALGNFLVERSNGSLITGSAGKASKSFEAIIGQIFQNKPTSDQVDKALRLMDEAVDCFDKAVGAAPDDPAVYGRRAAGRNSREFLKALVDMLSQSEPNPANLIKAMLSRKAAPDVWRMVDLSKNDPEAIAKAIFFEVFSLMLEKQDAGHVRLEPEAAWEQLPDDTHQLIQSSLNKLDNLGQSEDAKIAVRALELRGMVQQLVLKDAAGAESSLRRAIALDPKHEQAWELLNVLLFDAKRYADLVPLCEQHVKIKDTARNHIALAKAYEKLNQPVKIEDQINLAARLAPDDFAVLMSKSVLLLKGPITDDTFTRAQGLIGRAASRKGKALTRYQIFDLNYTTGILLALAGDMDHARQFLNQAQQIDPNNADVKEALSALF